MLTYRFESEQQTLYLRFLGSIVEQDLMRAFALYEDGRFSAESHVIFDTTGADIDFPVGTLSKVVGRYHNRQLRCQGARTAFVLDSGFKRAVAGMARAEKQEWKTHWRFFAQLEDAREWLGAQDVGSVDFGPTEPGGHTE